MRLSRTGAQVLAVAALAAAVTVFLSVAAVRHGFFDLRVYHGAVSFWVHGGGEIYDYLKPNSPYGYTYPPFAALVMLPLAYVGWHAAIVVSVAAAVVCTATVLWWLLDPVARREGWTRWFTLAVALCMAAAFEPMRETVNFGQVNAILLCLVAADLLWLVARGSRWGGVGIGLATAVKLTPGIFVLYLLVTGRWRAAATAVGAAAGVTVLAGALAPNASREFWTQALWDTDRVGLLAFVSNQSLRGVVARLNPDGPSAVPWLVLVAAALAVWAYRCRRLRPALDGVARGADGVSDRAGTPAAGPEATGLALTGVVGCLVSPVTWVHHLVWLLPALILLVDHGLAAPGDSTRRRRLLWFAGFAYALLISRFVWIWERGAEGVLGFLGSNAYVWVSIALLLALPVPERSGQRRGDAVRAARPGQDGLREAPRSSTVDVAPH
jgi:alpha-1,2-mannosyltransferase